MAAAIFVAIGGTARAGEFAVLSNGFRLHADRHEVDGSSVRLYDGAGVTSVASSEIAAFEAEEYKAPAARGRSCCRSAGGRR